MRERENIFNDAINVRLNQSSVLFYIESSTNFFSSVVCIPGFMHKNRAHIIFLYT